MATITISLPDTLKSFVESQIETKGYGNVSEYFRSLLRDAQEVMRMAHGLQRVDRDGQRAIGAVLEPHRCRQAAGHFTVCLRFRRARADRGPGDQFGAVFKRCRKRTVERQAATAGGDERCGAGPRE